MHHPTDPTPALGAAFATAVQPISAQTLIETDSAGLSTATFHISVDGQAVPVYRAQPEGKSNLPVVLVISEIFGVHAHIADVARRFARQGYLALAPDLFVRQGDAGKPASIADLVRDIISKTPDAEVMADLDACVAWAGDNGGDTGRLAVTGWCWGGRITWLYAAHNPNVKAGAAWYGKLVGDTSATNPRQPVDIAPGLTVPVLGLYGAKDGGIPLATVEKMKAALALGSSGSTFVVYPDAGHGFHADYRPGYVEADAKDGFARTLAWFKANGAA
jgi:carboxymethylenebutenolidase